MFRIKIDITKEEAIIAIANGLSNGVQFTVNHKFKDHIRYYFKQYGLSRLHEDRYRCAHHLIEAGRIVNKYYNK